MISRYTLIAACVLIGAFACRPSWGQIVPDEPKVNCVFSHAPRMMAPGPGEKLGKLADGLISYLAFDGDLRSLDANTIEGEAAFVRNSPAFFPDMSRVEKNMPRYFAGKFSGGIFVEYMHGWVTTNLLTAVTAQADNAPEGFSPFNGARLSKGEKLEGAASLKVDCDAPNAGFFTTPVTAPLNNKNDAVNNLTFSLYMRGKAGDAATLAVMMEGAPAPLATRNVTLAADWRREGIDFTITQPKAPEVGKDKSAPLSLVVTLTQPGSMMVDALMLESHLGYGGRRGMSSWAYGGKNREGEILYLPAPPNAQQGAVAFWMSPLGYLGWRCLLCIDNDHGWRPNARIDINHEKTLVIGVGDKTARGNLPAPIAPGEWHHVALTWEGKTLIAYFDGKAVATFTDAPERTRMGRINIGGVSTNFSPGVRADALFDEFAQWNRALAPAEIAALAARKDPLGAGIDVQRSLADREPVSVFARDDLKRDWPFRLTNRTKDPLEGVTISYGIAGVFEKTAGIDTIPPDHQCEFALPWSPALVQPGTYTMIFSFAGKDWRKQYSRQIEIVKARFPSDNAHVINWAGFGTDLAPLGITSGGIGTKSDGPLVADIEEATRNGLYSQVLQYLEGDGVTDDDLFVDCTGKRAGADQRSTLVRRDAEDKAERLAQRLALMPDVRQVIINTEKQWIHQMDFRPATIEKVKKDFGLDLKRWSSLPPADSWKVVHPAGRLSAAIAKETLPKNGILPLNHPFYAYHRWWHGAEAGTEVFLNDMIAEKVRAKAPWIDFIAEPALRRPPVQAFQKQQVIEEWFYYPSVTTAIWTQEGLAAAARGLDTRIAGMPQFLFKPGMAAPYGGLPTPMMYREAVWHCIARPTSGLTYWNLWGAITQGTDKNIVTQEEIDKRLGPTPTWDDAKAKTQLKGEWSDPYLFIPELKDEIGRMHNDTVHPLGALLPRWRNLPRQIAVYQSFAATLYSEIRWFNLDPLSAAVEQTGQPFDILYDQHFEKEDKLLDSYRVIALPTCSAITEPAAKQLRAFIARGGVVVVDDYFTADLPGVTRISWKGASDDAAELRKVEQALLVMYGRTDHPQYIEGMEQAVRNFANAAGPTSKAVAAIQAALAPEVTIPTRHVFYNALQAEEANYLVIVNDLRKPGRYYGHFNKVLDDGVAQTAELTMDAKLGSVAYLLTAAQSLALADKDGKLACRVDLDPCGGKVIVLLPEAIGKMTLARDEITHVEKGKVITFRAKLLTVTDKPVAGIIPLQATITLPDGTRGDLSRYAAFIKGEWSYEIPVAYNAPSGEYKLEVRELASDRKQTVTWRVP